MLIVKKKHVDFFIRFDAILYAMFTWTIVLEFIKYGYPSIILLVLNDYIEESLSILHVLWEALSLVRGINKK